MQFRMFEKGSPVKIHNHEHPWHGEIAIVREKRDIHTPYEESGVLIDDEGSMQREYTGGGIWYRIEVLGKRLWVPDHWLIPAEL